MLVKVLRKEKIGGLRLQPETIVDLDESVAKECIRRGVVASLGPNLQTNLAGRKLTLGDLPKGASEILVRTEGEDE